MNSDDEMIALRVQLFDLEDKMDIKRFAHPKSMTLHASQSF